MKNYFITSVLFKKGFWPYMVLVFLINATITVGQTKGPDGLGFNLSKENIRTLFNAPQDVEDGIERKLYQGIELDLTLPDGKVIPYYFFKNKVMSAEMLRDYPELVTLTGYSLVHTNHFVNVTVFKDKLHAFILSDYKLPIIIDRKEDGSYHSYYAESKDTYTCGTEHSGLRDTPTSGLRTSTNGATLKNYDFAIVITDEYEAGNGGTTTAVATAVTTVSDMTTVYKRDLAVTFTATVRPETSVFNIDTTQATAANGAICVNSYFMPNEYDLGMTFFKQTLLGGGGVAYVGKLCIGGTPPLKAGSWSQGNPNNDYSFMSIVAHEVAHLFNATHTFNGTAFICGIQNNLNTPTAYEPGSGTTMMAYPGVCSTHNITDASGNTIYDTSPYFHANSLALMVAYINGNGNNCPTATSTGNTPPIANANPCNASSPVSIPANTPFELVGGYTDPGATGVTYNWEQYDLGPNGAPNVNCGASSGPIFRSYLPTSNPTRSFPSLQYILNNANVPPFTTIGECLPTATRTLNFRLTVRDNNVNGGGIDISALQLQVVGTAGPLAVTSPNTAITLTAGSNHTVTWSVNNTNSVCNTVNILLSIDGGNNFPYTLATSTTNDGSQSITLPSNIPATSLARIKVVSSCFTCVRFFDISNVNFTISSSCGVATNTICPETAISVPFGNPALNLGLTQSYGSAIASKIMTTSGNAVNVSYNLSPPNAGSGNCTSANFGSFRQVSIKFKISQAGNYTFDLGSSQFLSVYNGSYSTSSPCTNYIGSTVYDLDGVPFGNYNYDSGMTLNLTNVCGEYTAVLFGPTGTSATLSISGPVGAIIYENNPPAGSGYSYTYAAVNTTTNLISAVSATSNFITLTGGSYCVYGMHYNTTLNPTNWVGQSISGLLSAGNCLLPSNNCKPVTINCAAAVTSSAPSGPGSLLELFSCSEGGGTVNFAAGISPTLTSPLLIDKDIIFDGNVDGMNNPTTSIFLNFAGSYGIKVNPAKNVTFKDLNIQMLGTASPVIINEGSMQLNNAEIRGNVTPVMTNQPSATLQIQNNVKIKKQ